MNIRDKKIYKNVEMLDICSPDYELILIKDLFFICFSDNIQTENNIFFFPMGMSSIRLKHSLYISCVYFIFRLIECLINPLSCYFFG